MTLVPHDDSRVLQALRGAKIARIAALTPRGRPLIVPLYFVVLDGRIYLSSAATSPVVRGIAEHPRVLVLMQSREGEVVRARGAATFRRDASIARRVRRASLRKYFLRPRAIWSMLRNAGRLPARRQYTRERPDTGMIEVVPESYSVGPA